MKTETTTAKRVQRDGTRVQQSQKILTIKTITCNNSSNLFWNKTLHVSDSSSVHHQEFFTVHKAMVYVIQLVSRIAMELVPSWYCSQAVSKPVWHIPLLCVQCQTTDDGQRNRPKHVKFYSKTKFEKLVHLVCFIIRIYQDAWSPDVKVTENVKAITSLCHLHLSNGFTNPLEMWTWPCMCQEGILDKWRYNSMHSSHQQQMAVFGQSHTPQTLHCWYPLNRHMKPMKDGSKQEYNSEPFEWESSVIHQHQNARLP